MASGLLMLLDDIATVLDDISVMTKVAVKKTAGVLGDDLALNAQQVAGVDAKRELPVVWAVAKGSLVNKAVLVPLALALSLFTPEWVIGGLLIMGGLYLCYEGCEKLAHKYLHSDKDVEHRKELKSALVSPDVDLVQLEREKIRGAIRTDFILSAEIIVITLGTVTGSPFGTQLAVLVAIAMLMTVGVYGLVAGIVKLDDLGKHLMESDAVDSEASFRQRTGYAILVVAPYLMKFLSIAGTVAMFLVGGGILAHGIPVIHHWIEAVIHPIETLDVLGPLLAGLSQMLLQGLIGIVGGASVLATVKGTAAIRGRTAGTA